MTEENTFLLMRERDFELLVVTHELASIFAIGNNCVFLDAEAKTIIAQGDPKGLLAHSRDPTVHRFLSRGEEERL